MFSVINPSLALPYDGLPEGIIEGHIKTVNRSSCTYDVQHLRSPRILEGCRWAVGGLFAPLFGFSMEGLLEEGSHVLVLVGNPNFIIHSLPSYLGCGKATAESRAVGDGVSTANFLGAKSKAADFSGTNVAGDMVEGEFSIANALGSGVDFLLNIIRLRSGRSFVEACLLDESVRIVSRNFTQHDAGGDTLVTDDGRINKYQSFTTYQHEAWGHLQRRKLIYVSIP